MTLAEAAEWQAATLEATNGVPAVYMRTGQAPLPITVVPGRVHPERYALADGRATLEVQPADFLIRPAALDFGSGPVPPQVGDRISLENGRIYELLPRDGEPCYRPDQQKPASYRVRSIMVPASAVKRRV